MLQNVLKLLMAVRRLSLNAFCACITALGAVGIAALGVVGVYQMSSWVADKSGRSMDADATGLPAPPIVLSAELLKARKVTMAESSLSFTAAGCVKQALNALSAPACHEQNLHQMSDSEKAKSGEKGASEDHAMAWLSSLFLMSW